MKKTYYCYFILLIPLFFISCAYDTTSYEDIKNDFDSLFSSSSYQNDSYYLDKTKTPYIFSLDTVSLIPDSSYLVQKIDFYYTEKVGNIYTPTKKFDSINIYYTYLINSYIGNNTYLIDSSIYKITTYNEECKEVLKAPSNLPQNILSRNAFFLNNNSIGIKYTSKYDIYIKNKE